MLAREELRSQEKLLSVEIQPSSQLFADLVSYFGNGYPLVQISVREYWICQISGSKVKKNTFSEK
ncbi:unnamed protein product [Coffea canephora]|uniref:DH200=94 genomic scaffold, scaffold_409 n=1 Tax=Coffea canephora TaxID=49390 RepID=A0A068VEQ1_COFCA|nr:unnamed protein product [Coffea canephora]